MHADSETVCAANSPDVMAARMSWHGATIPDHPWPRPSRSTAFTNTMSLRRLATLSRGARAGVRAPSSAKLKQNAD